MATIGKDANGSRRVLFVAPDGKRKTVRLGKCSQRDAEQVCRHIEALLSALTSRQPVLQETAAWVAELPPMLHDRLARAGLVQARANQTGAAIGPFIDAYIQRRTDLKPGTHINLDRARRELRAHFGPGRNMATVTPADADAFRLALLEKGLGENTVRRMCGRARQYFRAALRAELIRRNPFDGIKTTVGANPARAFHVTPAMAQKVLDACPDNQWRVLFALSRYGGLRCPSEHLALRWGDINWEQARMTIHSPKTEHHDGKAFRVIPIFPELLPHLETAFHEAEPGSEYVITRYRQANANLRTQLNRIIAQAGLKPWPKLFQNLRATRETELAERFPLHVVCDWIGHSPKVAQKHYLQVTDDHFTLASRSAAQNPAQQRHATGRNAPQQQTPETKNPANCGGFLVGAASCEIPNINRMTGLGLEPRTNGLKGRCSTN